MKYRVTLTNGVSGEFEADSEKGALAKAQQALEEYAETIDQPIPEGLEPETAEIIDGE